jgi:DNA mismatch repair protein MutS
VLARARAILDDLERGAALPNGAYASPRKRAAPAKDQLGLFGQPPNPGGASAVAAGRAPRDTNNTAIETLRAVDVDRLTPLEALQLVATLKARL